MGVTELFNYFLKMTVESSYLILAVLAVRFVFKKGNKSFRKLLWALVGIKLLFPISIESRLSLMPVKNAAKVAALSDSALNSAQGIEKGFDYMAAFSYIWLFVLTVGVIYGAFSFFKLSLKIKDAVKFKDNIYQSEKISSPFVCGVIKPKIIVPYNLKSEVLECVLIHEKTHLKNYDNIIKVMGYLVLCVYWFNPLVWLSYVLLNKDIELACDECVIKNMSLDNRKRYANALCELGVSKIRVSAFPVSFGEVSIKERILNTIKYKKTKKSLVALSLVAVFVVAVCFMTKPIKDTPEPLVKDKVASLPVTVQTTEPSATVIPSEKPKKEKPKKENKKAESNVAEKETSAENNVSNANTEVSQNFDFGIENLRDNIFDSPFHVDTTESDYEDNTEITEASTSSTPSFSIGAFNREKKKEIAKDCVQIARETYK